MIAAADKAGETRLIDKDLSAVSADVRKAFYLAVRFGKQNRLVQKTFEQRYRLQVMNPVRRTRKMPRP